MNLQRLFALQSRLTLYVGVPRIKTYARSSTTGSKKTGPILCLLSLLMCFSVGDSHADTGNSSTAIHALIRQGENYRQVGHYREARTAFSEALALAKQHSIPRAEALAAGLLGNNHLQQRRYQQAKPLLENAWKMAKQHSWPGIAALHANFLGNYHTNQRQPDQAQYYYQGSLDWALKAQDNALALQAKLNLSRLAYHQKDEEQAWKLLNESHTALEAIGSSNDRMRFSLQIGYQLLRPAGNNVARGNKRLELAYQMLTAASRLAMQQSDERSLSLAQGYLGELYESQNRIEDALLYTEQAVDIAQRIDAKDLLLKWEWQHGRLFKAQGRTQAALAAYRRAVDYIEATRQDIPVDYHRGRSSFRETLEPVYIGLADLLLQEVDRLDSAKATKVLKEVRQTVELIKKTELEDYFNNRCAIQTLPKVNLERIAPKAATLYPIMLPDRLELLVGIGADIHHRTVPIPSTEIRKNAKSLAAYLRRRVSAYKIPAQQLYRWLIEPIDDLMQGHHIDTLVVIPDGALRLVPFAALLDDERHLIERYAVVTSPGLTLFDPQPIDRKGITSLLAGLSKPGPVINALPIQHLQALVTSALVQTRDQRGQGNRKDIGDLLFAGAQTGKPLASIMPSKVRELLKDPVIFKKCQEALSLPGVKKEIDALSELLSSTDLVNESFMKERLRGEILKSPFRVVHIASHGFFGHSSDQSFIMTYDQLVTVDQLESLLMSEDFGDTPIELLTLSACQTAEGDDRAPLGLSGVALKARVRSVLGSLWPVSDEATVQLMENFYMRLNSPNLSKAQALQQAQITLLKDRKRSHPYYWSPFILVGNWL